MVELLVNMVEGLGRGLVGYKILCLFISRKILTDLL